MRGGSDAGSFDHQSDQQPVTTSHVNVCDSSSKASHSTAFKAIYTLLVV
jgi:hypothetical protein